MKITKLTAENIKRISAIEIEPNGNVIVVGGRNNQGKTSVLDAISMALGGKDEVPEKPIREGETSAVIILETDEITVTRRFTKGGSSLTVTNREGTKLNSPQSVLDALTSRVSFDPLGFIRQPSKEQATTLRNLVGLDFAKMDAQRKELYDNRTNLNRDVATQQARMEGYEHDASVPDVEVSVSELGAKLQAAQTKIQENDAQRSAALRCKAMVENANERVVTLQAGIKTAIENVSKLETEALNALEIYIKQERAKIASDKLQREATIKDGKEALAEWEEKQITTSANYKKLQEEAASLVDPDTTIIVEEMTNAESVNVKIRAKREWRTEKSKLEALLTQSNELTKEIQTLDHTKAKQLAGAKFPVKGLSFDETGVLFNDLPFSQASGAEQLRVSLAISCALNPKLPVMLIRDGSLLDEDSMKLVAETAEAHGAQVWIEFVSTDKGKCTVIIEDGAIQE